MTSSFDQKAKYDAQCLAEKICTFSFICSVYVWHDVLTKINFVSKILQSVNVNMQVALDTLADLKNFLNGCRTEEKFETAVNNAKEIAARLQVETEFETLKPLRRRKTPRAFDYEHEDQAPQMDSKTSFKVNVYFYILDQALMSVKERFDLLFSHNKVFSFLFKLSDVQEKSQLTINCNHLMETLSVSDGSSDIDAEDLCEEILSCQSLFKDLNNDVTKILEFIFLNNLAAICPNLTVSLRILITMPVTVASAERSFSKLKLIKNFLRSTMSQERLSNLAMISIEGDILENMDTHNIIKDFASRKARKVDFV